MTELPRLLILYLLSGKSDLKLLKIFEGGQVEVSTRSPTYIWPSNSFHACLRNVLFYTYYESHDGTHYTQTERTRNNYTIRHWNQVSFTVTRNKADRYQQHKSHNLTKLTISCTATRPTSTIPTHVHSTTQPWSQDSITTLDLTSWMKQSLSWEADSRSATPEISRLLWNPKFHYSVHESPPLDTKRNHSWEADSRSATLEISRLLWNPKFHYSVHESPPLDTKRNHSSEDDSRSATRDFEPSVKPKGSLQCSQKPATGPYTEPLESCPHPHTIFRQDQF